MKINLIKLIIGKDKINKIKVKFTSIKNILEFSAVPLLKPLT